MQSPFYRLLFLTGAILTSSSAMAADRDVGRPPNVVLILADDLGFSDTTLFGTTSFYRTPNIERLAAMGMTFSHSYSSSPLCSPTRASVLTGLSPARHGITAPVCHLPTVILEPSVPPIAAPNQKAILPTSVTRLEPKYFTLAEALKQQGYATGHFGKWHLGPEPYSPLQHGFDVDVPHFNGPGPAGSYVAPWRYTDFDPRTPNEHIEDRMADEAADFMTRHRDEPFFLNYWMFSVHAPFDAKPDLIDAYADRVDPSSPQRNPTYAAMIESMDDAVGTLIDTVERLGVADNTIFVFASDNGGNMYNSVDGVVVTDNSPLRGGKATMYEGGVRGPAIVVAPGQVDAGSTSEEVIQSSDFYPTLLEMLSIDPQPNQFFDGISIVPALKGGELSRDAIYTFFPHSPGIPEWLPPSVAMHQGDWKLIRLFHQGENGDHRYKLFHLSDDVGETKNLASEFPDRVVDMDRQIEDFLQRTNAVVPKPNPKFDPAKYDPSREGVGTLKEQRKAAPVSKPRPAGKPVAGWTPHADADLQRVDGGLKITSVGGDPWIDTSLNDVGGSGPFRLQLSMSAKSSGRGQVFWQTATDRAFTASRAAWFDVDHDDELHQYDVAIEATEPLTSIRIDPARDKGSITLMRATLRDVDGEVVWQWLSRP